MRAECDRESGCSWAARRFAKVGQNAIVFLIGMLTALTGCGSYRDVTFLYYPDAPPSDRFPPAYRFYAEASRECAKYGMRAVHNWDNYTFDFERIRVNYTCEP